MTKELYIMIQSLRMEAGSNAFWSPFNKEYLLLKIKILSKRNKIDTMMVFEFSSPYTKIQILKFITKLFELYRCW